MDEPKYKRVLLKISGEALAGEKHFGLDFQVLGQVADVIKECVNMGVQIGVVIGGGNFWRGVKNGEGHIERTRADHMGMLATAMNCMALADVLEQKGVDVRLQTALEIREVAEPYIRARAVRHLEKGRVVLFGCGGDRSRLRRYGMGEVASKMADFLILTEDNNRFERVEDIIADIKVGIAQGRADVPYVEIPDRLEAIHYALDHAREGDLIAVIGKGHEAYRDRMGEKTPFLERELIEEYAAQIGLE